MGFRLITSRQNEIYRFLKALTETHTRKKKGAFLLEGATFVSEVLDNAAWSVSLVALTPEFIESERGKAIWEKAQRSSVPVVLIAPALIAEICTTETPQGVVAAVKQPKFERLEKIKVGANAIFVVLESVQDPSNVGAIVRSADAVGASAVLYTKGTADPYAPKAVRASAGSLLHVPVLPVGTSTDAINWLKSKEVQIVGTVVSGGVSIFEAEYAEKVAVFVGNEAKGLSEEVKSSVDLLISIPMVGKAESLNVSVATSIFLYEILRRRLKP